MKTVNKQEELTKDCSCQTVNKQEALLEERSVQIDSLKMSAQDLKNRLLKVSDECRALKEQLRAQTGDKAHEKALEGHVTQLRQQLVAAVELNQAHSQKNAALREKILQMRDLISRSECLALCPDTLQMQMQGCLLS